MEKLPNWLRYLIAIPLGIFFNVLIYWAVYYSNLFYSHPESMYMKLLEYIYINCVQIFIFFYFMNKILPKHQFIFTITISIIYCSLCLFAIGLTFSEMTYVWSDYIAFALSIGAFIYSCYYTFNEYPTPKAQQITEYTNPSETWEEYLSRTFGTYGTKTSAKDIKINGTPTEEINADHLELEKCIILSSIIINGSKSETIDDAIELAITQYDLKNINIISENKEKILAQIIMLGADTSTLEETIELAKQHYNITNEKI